ncbi:MAG TPA: sigma-70 family RNA polymerase sigma factor [Solirubrobacteraceae bacterium]
MPRGRSDEALVARVRAGDDRAFELIFDRYHRGLLAFCARMLGAREEAEDALQHTFMAAYRALRATGGEIRLRAWLYTIARNRCLSVLRARREQVAFDEMRGATNGLAADVDRRAELRGLLADLERLPEEQRAALVLFELGDHSHDEIAEILGVPREKVKALVFQAREALAGWRRARETPCAEIREQLATLRGAALKRATLRRHVARCESCREFEAEVRRQRSAIGALLPIAPTAGFKAAVLSSVLGGGAAASGAGGGAAVAGLGAAKGLAAKTMLCAAIAGSAGSAGYVAVRDIDAHRAPAPKQAQVTHHAKPRHDKAAPRPAPRVAPARLAVTTPIATVAAAKPAAPAAKPSRNHARHWREAGKRRGFGARRQHAAVRWSKPERRGVQRRFGGGKRGGGQRPGGWKRGGEGHGGARGRGGAQQRGDAHHRGGGGSRHAGVSPR